MARDFESYENLIEETDINIKNENGASLLRIAVAYGSEDIALDLIARGIDIDQRDRKGTTELQNALLVNLPKVAYQLIAQGADLHHRDHYGNNALWYASTHPKRDLELVRLLVEKGSDIITQNAAGRSPIDAAQERGDELLLEILRNP